MTLERMLRLVILQIIKAEYFINDNFAEWLKSSYNLEKIDEEYIPLLKEFLNDYALNKTEKSD